MTSIQAADDNVNSYVPALSIWPMRRKPAKDAGSTGAQFGGAASFASARPANVTTMVVAGGPSRLMPLSSAITGAASAVALSGSRDCCALAAAVHAAARRTVINPDPDTRRQQDTGSSPGMYAPIQQPASRAAPCWFWDLFRAVSTRSNYAPREIGMSVL